MAEQGIGGMLETQMLLIASKDGNIRRAIIANGLKGYSKEKKKQN